MEVHKRCVSCGKVENKMSACGGCSFTFYCSRACQKKDWPTHKAECNGKSKKYYYVKQLNKNEGYQIVITAFHNLIKNLTNIEKDKEPVLMVNYNFHGTKQVASFHIVYHPQEFGKTVREQAGFAQESVLVLVYAYGQNGFDEFIATASGDGNKSDLEICYSPLGSDLESEKITRAINRLPLTEKEPFLVSFQAGKILYYK